MRLLKLSDDGELSLIERSGDSVPEYAILSHTWGPDGDEVTYEDLMTEAGRHKPGYDKIRFCGNQAKIDGLQFFWIDTCCIDKRNYTELSTAINSMFRWYHDATRCYVYLSDVPDPQDPASVVESAFPNSRWFKRGWTLQELVAPSSVLFFSRYSECLGSKKSREQRIYEITGVAVEALRGNALSHFSIDERLSWAAKRQTTVEEDAAYCLLGIFDIQMPLIYGEGRQKALDRLQRKIRKSLGAPTVSNQAAWIVPFERNPRFTGRKRLLTQLEGILFAKDHTAKTAIVGLGGVGKTQLTLELLFQTKDKHSDCSIIWIPATNNESLHQGYLDAAQQLGIPGWDGDKEDVKRLLQRHLSKESTGRWLLVFDNADDIDMWIAKVRSRLQARQGPRPLIDYLPKSKQGAILFTTRDRRLAVKLAQQNVVEVPEMGEDAAAQLLEKCLVDPKLVESRQDTSALLSQLTYLPLAIVQAAAYINENGIAIADYLSLLADQEEEVIDLLSEEFEDDGRYRDVKNPIATTWLISFEQIRQRDPLAAEYLSFMACVEPKDIPRSLLPPGPTRKKEIEAIGTLNAYSFITRRPTDMALDLHRLVHLVTRNWLREEKQLSQSTEKAILRLYEVFPNEDHKNRAIWRTYLPHARYVLQSELAHQDGQAKIDLMWKYAVCLHSDGRWNEAEVALREVMETRKRVLGPEHERTLASMSNLASTFIYQGKWKQAEELFEDIMHISERALGPDHPSTLKSMADKAAAAAQQSRWLEAEKLLLKTRNSSLEILGENHRETLKITSNLARIHLELGRWKDAEVLFLPVVEAREQTLGPDHPDTLFSRVGLASALMNQGRWVEAEADFMRLLEISMKSLGEQHLITISILAKIAMIYRHQGRWQQAEEFFRQAVDASSKHLGPEHPNTLACQVDQGTTFLDFGRLDSARVLLRKVWLKIEEKMGIEHPDVLRCKAGIASILRQEGKLDESQQLGIDVIETRKRVLGPEHPDTLTGMEDLALTYNDQGPWNKAEELEVQVMETRKRKLGAEHPDTLIIMANLASTYRNQGRWEEAEELNKQVMEISKKKLGADHPSTDRLLSQHKLARAYRANGQIKEAVELLERIVSIRAEVLAEDHPDRLISEKVLATFYDDLSQGLKPDKP